MISKYRNDSGAAVIQPSASISHRNVGNQTITHTTLNKIECTIMMIINLWWCSCSRGVRATYLATSSMSRWNCRQTVSSNFFSPFFFNIIPLLSVVGVGWCRTTYNTGTKYMSIQASLASTTAFIPNFQFDSWALLPLSSCDVVTIPEKRKKKRVWLEWNGSNGFTFVLRHLQHSRISLWI